MQAVLSFDQAPPFAAPFRFFLGAAVFPLLAGLLLVVDGPAAFSSRWAPGALALTHLIAVGFMLQVMLGAMIQILPVVAGANLGHPLAVARTVHLLVMPGALALAGAFLLQLPTAFLLAMVLLAGGCGVFLFFAVRSLFGVPATSASIANFKLALLGLFGLLLLGLMLAGGLAGYWAVPLVDITHLHANWALAAWALMLLSGVAYVVVPMFQITPSYPTWFSRYFGRFVLLAVVSTSGAILFADEETAGLLQTLVVAAAALFASLTLWLQARSKRSKPDATQKFWRLAMLSGLAAALLWSAARLLPGIAAWENWIFLFGVLVFVGGFMSVIVGMLYKIVPFLIWLHLQNRGQGQVTAPNMKVVLAEARMLRHLRFHLAACLLLLAASAWPAIFARLAGLALAASGFCLLANLLAAAGVYRRHAAMVDARLADLAAEGKGGVA